MNARQQIVNSTLVSVLALAVIVPVFLVASVSVLRLIREGYLVETEIRRAQDLTSQLLVLQLDEETAIRGYLNTGRSEFLEPYRRAEPEFSDVAPRLEALLVELGVAGGTESVHAITTLNHQWRSSVAVPLLRQRYPQSDVASAVHGKQLIDEERTVVKQVADSLTAREALAQQQTARGFVRATVFAVLTTLVLGGAILGFGLFLTRYELELQRERSVIEKLQRAFVHRWEPLPGATVGTAYLSATSEALIGGDVFDVRMLDPECGYVLIADVSGKGIEAAVDTAFVKFTISALSLEGRDPGLILGAFNRLVFGSLSYPDAFIVAFFGIVDAEQKELRYASAGHSSAFIRRGASVQQLAITGSIIGLSAEETYDTQTVALQGDDLIVLATDGLTEARDPGRRMLTEEGAMRWIAEAESSSAQGIADEIVQRLRRFVGSRRLDDDLALVIVRFRPDSVPAVPPSPALD
ncbi:MAG: SpoIIE family protein phosphatase [Candidatus Eremiobacteraeota bacterium]|nr:SpoIIE family protein phosphatase [Candidatus Eremiobacteraeota bacterium]